MLEPVPNADIPISVANLRQYTSFLLVCLSSSLLGADEPIRFSRDILPILSDRCFHCHGPDESHREADLRLDQKESALESAIVPRDPSGSELIQRIISEDPDELMPPPDSHRKPLTPKEKQTLKKWIEQGAQWGKHWAFEKPVRPPVPSTKKHPIDAFVQNRLQEQKLDFSDQAPPHTLIRRVGYDLLGLPPSLDETREFTNSPTQKNYEAMVDKWLASEHFGERMAMWWLDAARYSDTDGYQGDATRNNWPWRDWVVDSFNSNKSFRQFTIEQFAGDLLPNATPEQKLATCFHRNHMFNGEGGRHPEESRIEYVIDRVNTMGTVWLGLTLGCTQCHSHKFDPVSQKDYYQLFAFFDSIDEDGKAGGGAKPFMKYQSKYGSRDVAEMQNIVNARRTVESAARKRAEADFEKWFADRRQTIARNYLGWKPVHPLLVYSVEGTKFAQAEDGTVQALKPSLFQDDYKVVFKPDHPKVTGLKLEVLSDSTHTQGKFSLGKTGEFTLTDVKLQVRRQGDTQTRDIEIASAIANGEKKVGGRAYGKVSGTLDDDPRNGWTTAGMDNSKSYAALFALRQPLELESNEELIFVMLHRSTHGDSNIGRFRISVCHEPGNAVRSFDKTPLEKLAADLSDDQHDAVQKETRQSVLSQFLTEHEEYQKARSETANAQRELNRLKKAAGSLNVNVLAERKEPRKSFVLKRGVWDQKGEQVSKGFPAELFGPSQIEPQSRLDLAQWLVSSENPLTARVMVNQLWQLCFGQGLVRTSNDFGLQGEFPTHPDLLDWLAVEFMESDWDVKHILRLIVTSQTYQQSSVVSPALLEKDPKNKWLARNTRYRLPSWMIRDSALKTSGLLNPKLGGATVMPYQPEGIWSEIFMGRFRYQPSQGAAQFRRTLYAFWRRSSAPTFLFDSSQRRVCEVSPRRTNTPLHALTLLNDLSLREAARRVATLAAERKTQREQLTLIFESILLRTPTQKEWQLLSERYELALDYYEANPAEARTYLTFGQPENEIKSGFPKVAALTIFASLVYNLDEAMTRE